MSEGASLTRDQLAAEAYRLVMLGHTRAQVAELLSEHYTGRMDAPTTGWVTGLLRHHKRVMAAQYGVSEYTLRGGETVAVRIPVFTGALELDWERCIVCGDVHLPTTDFALAETMIQIAKRRGITRLIIGGDLINADAYSKFEHLIAFQSDRPARGY